MNCNRPRDDLSVQTCCYFESRCKSFCVRDDELTAPIDSEKILNKMKKDKYCPTTLKRSDRACIAHQDCPRNQVCCRNEGSEMRCSDPKERIPGKCPVPIRIPGGTLDCVADDDCNEQGYTGDKCCRLDDDNYKCAPPEDIAIIPVPDIPDVTSAPITNKPNNPVTPSDPAVPIVCPRKNSLCPMLMTSCDNPNCQSGTICCVSSQGTQRCVLPIGTKPGKCPPRDLVRKTGNECYFDTNCRGRRKCCGGRDCDYYSCTNPE